MRFTINLATRTHLDHRLINRLAYAAIALLVIVTGWNVSRISSHMGEQSRLKDEITALQNKLGGTQSGISESDINRQKSRIRFYNDIIARKNVNWVNLLDTFESVTPAGIALSVLAPDKKQGEWKVEGHARSFKTVRLYVEKLESSEKFSHVLLLSHQVVAVGEKERGVQFSISCAVRNQ